MFLKIIEKKVLFSYQKVSKNAILSNYNEFITFTNTCIHYN